MKGENVLQVPSIFITKTTVFITELAIAIFYPSYKHKELI